MDWQQGETLFEYTLHENLKHFCQLTEEKIIRGKAQQTYS